MKISPSRALRVFALVIVCTAVGWWLARSSAPQTPSPDNESDHARQVLYWYDPMKPEVHFDAPGPSPFMDMALVPKYAGTGSATANDSGVVEIDPGMVQNLGLRTAAVKSGRFSHRLRAAGSVRVDERRIVSVETRAAGWVERLDVRAVGDSVRRGQVLAGLYAPELLAAQEELAMARRLGDARLTNSAQARLKLLGVSPGARPQRRVDITAPQSGVVTELLVREGAQLMPGTALMKLADLSKVWIMVEIPEREAAWVAQGQVAQARLRGLPGRLFEGRVEHVYPVLDTQTRTLSARIAFDNADAALKPGMYAEVTVLGGTQQDVALVPSEAVIRTGTRSVVLVAEAPGRYRPVAVEVGDEVGEDLVVLSGLEPGQEVVISGQFLIDSEASLLGFYNRSPPSTAAHLPPLDGPELSP